MQVGNTKYGYEALKNNAQGSNNSAFGSNALQYTDSSWNTSVGACANMMNVSGISNIAVGTNTLLSNTAGSYNTAIGTASLLNNKANSNTSVGSNSMQSNTDGAENIAVGVQAGYNNTTGSKNIFIGNYTGLENINGSNNVFLGHNAGLGGSGGPNNYSGNTFLGANTTNPNGYDNATAIGYNSEALVPNGITMGNYGETVLIPGDAYLTNTSSSNQIATQGYVQMYTTIGIVLVAPCACATTTDICLAFYNAFIDGVPISNNDRVLVKCQSTPSGWINNDSTDSIDNGIYIYKYNGPTDASFSRAIRCQIGNNAIGQSTLVRGGVLNRGTLFKQVNDPAIVGDNSLNYIALATSDYSLGNGLEFVGNELNVKSDLTDQNGAPFLTNVTILERLKVDGSLNVVGDVLLNNKLSVGGDASLNGKLNVVSDVSLNSKLNVGGSLNVDGSLNVVSDVSLNQKLRVGGDVSLNSKLNVDGSLNVVSDVSLNSKLSVGSDVSMNSKLYVVSDVSLNQKLRVGSDVSLNGKLTVIGDASFGKIDCSNNLRITCNFADSGGIIPAFEPMEMINYGNGNKLSFCLNGGTGSYNKIVNSGDNIFVYNGGPGQDAALSIVPYDTSSASVISNGLRMTETTTMLGSGGTGTLPTHRLTTSTTGVVVDGSMSVISDISINGIRVGKGRNNISTNMFIGYSSGTSTISGGYNISIGYDTLKLITGGLNNVAVGYNSGPNITAGKYNVFMGTNSGWTNNGELNVMIGDNVSGTLNPSVISGVSRSVIIGAYAGYGNQAHDSCFIGYESGRDNSVGTGNTFVGCESGSHNVNGNYNTFVGFWSGTYDVSGSRNTFFGYLSGQSTKSSDNCFFGSSSGSLNVDGHSNCYLGSETGRDNSTGCRNCYIGYHAGHKSTSGNDNIFVGPDAGYFVNGINNVMIGSKSGSGTGYTSSSSYCVMIGHDCGRNNFESGQCFVGFQSGYKNTDGSCNTFIGYQSGRTNTIGNSNTFIGYQAGYSDVSASYNTFIGHKAGYSDLSGNDNTFIGNIAGYADVSGSGNVYIGSESGKSNMSDDNCFIGAYAARNNLNGKANCYIGRFTGGDTTKGDFNVFLGKHAGLKVDGDSNVIIGCQAGKQVNSAATLSNCVIIGKGAGYNNDVSSSCFVGFESGVNNTTGTANTFFGYQSGSSNNIGNFNTSIGYQAGLRDASGSGNTFVGCGAGQNNKMDYNCFFGLHAGENNATGKNNCFFGTFSGAAPTVTTGDYNVFMGTSSAYNVAGSCNVIIGNDALGKNTLNAPASLVSNSVIIGNSAGYLNSVNDSCFIGFESGKSNTDGSRNTFIGYQTGYNNATGNRNTSIGYQAGFSNKRDNNCYFGYQCGFNDVSGSNNSFFGYNADISTNLSPITNSTAIGANAKVDASNQIVLGTLSERVKIPGKMWCVGDASFSHVNITTGSGIRFSDNTVQVTAFTGTAQSQTITFTTTTSAYVIPSGVYKIDLKVIGRGGDCGDKYTFPGGSPDNYGGSGAGGQTVMISNSPIISDVSLAINFVDTSSSIGYVEVVSSNITSAPTTIAKAYNGGNGQNGSSSGPGAGGIPSSITSYPPVMNANYGCVSCAFEGSNGHSGGVNAPPAARGTIRGSPYYFSSGGIPLNTSTNYGNGRWKLADSTWPTGAVILTCYYM